MTTTPSPDQNPPGAADDAHVDQGPGVGQGLEDASGDDEPRREVGVTAAVERGPAELSDEGDPVPDDPHIALEDRDPARSTDDL